MEYKLLTGESLQGETFEEIILAMKGQKWEKELDTDQYMCRVSERVKTQSGHDIRHDTAHNFIEDMIASGYLIKK